MKNPDRRNKYFFGLGTIGRDMFYAFEANALLYFLSNILSLPIHVFAAVSLVLSVLRIADALNDPITGLVIDNIHTKWGKFKPAILVGGVVSVIFYLILFGNVGTGTAYVIFFAAAYVLWDISYGINDIAYWTLLPALTQDQKQRENYGAFARICANIGMYIIMVGWQPITAALGNTPKAWMTVAVSVSVIYLAGLCFPLFGVRRTARSRRTTRSSPSAICGTPSQKTISSCGRRSPWRCLWSATARRPALRRTICSISTAISICTPFWPPSAAWHSWRH